MLRHQVSINSVDLKAFMQEMSGHMLGVLKKIAAGEGMAKVRLHAAVVLRRAALLLPLALPSIVSAAESINFL